MFSKVRDMFKLPPSPFSLGKPSFSPVKANPIKVPERRFSDASRDSDYILKNVRAQRKEDLEGAGRVEPESEMEEEANVYKAEGSKRRKISNQDDKALKIAKRKRGSRESQLRESVVEQVANEDDIVPEPPAEEEVTGDEAIEDYSIKDPKPESHRDSLETIISPPPASQIRKNHSHDREEKNASPKQRRKKRKLDLESLHEPRVIKEAPNSTHEGSSSPPETVVNGSERNTPRDPAKQQRREERRRRKLEKAERKKRKKQCRLSEEFRVSEIDMKDSVAVEPIANEIRKESLIESSDTVTANVQMASQELGETLSPKQKKKASRKKKSDQEGQRQEHVEEKTANQIENEEEDDEEKPETEESTHAVTQSPISKSKSKRSQKSVPTKSRQVSNSASISPKKVHKSPSWSHERVVSNERILDSDAEDEPIEESPQRPRRVAPTAKRRKVKDLEKLSTPIRVSRARPLPSPDFEEEEDQTPWVFTEDEDAKIRKVVKELKKREKISDQEFVDGLLNKWVDGLVDDLKEEDWGSKSIDSVHDRIGQLYLRGVKLKGMYTPREEEIVESEINTFLKIRKWSEQEFAVWLAEDVKQFWAKRESRELCKKITQKLPGRDTLSVTRHLLSHYPVEVLPGGWTPQDDAQLRNLVATKGKQWKVIAEEMGRAADIVRMRYRDYVSLGDKRTTGQWTAEDLSKLYKIVLQLLEPTEWNEEEGLDHDIVGKYIDWDAVGKKLGNRNRLQCLKKWKKLDSWGNGVKH